MVTVLIVDDDAGTVQTIREVLDLEGIRGVGTTDPSQAGAIARTIQPDVIVVDLMLAGNRCGLEVAEELCEAGFAETPMIAITGSPLQAEIARETDLFAQVVDKPFDFDDLLLAITDAAATRTQP